MAESDLRSAIITAVDAIDKAIGALSAATISHVIAPVTANATTVRTASPDAFKSADDKIRAATNALKDAVAKSNSRTAGDPAWATAAPAKPTAPAVQAPAGKAVMGVQPAAKPLFGWGKPK